MNEEGEGEEAMTEAGEKEALPPCMSSGGVDLAQKKKREGLIGFLVFEWMKI